MFRFIKTNTFKHRVEVSIPGDDPDRPISGSFICTSKRHDKDAFRDLVDGKQGGGDEDFIRETLVSVEGLEVEGIDPGNQAALIDVIARDVALSAAYISGYAKASVGAAEKNSARSSRR